jgi:hypothetical protein
MSELRHTLIEAGWQQGVILQPGPFDQKEAFGFLVLNQTCDCVNPDFEKEPYLELLPLEKVKGKPNSKLKNGENPREIHFQMQENGQEIWAHARIATIFHFDRSKHDSLKFATDCALSSSSLDDLIHWRAQRYVRTAFPDSFEMAFRALSKKFGKMMSKHEKFIDSLLLSISPFEEIEPGDCYTIQLRLMATPTVMAQPGISAALHTLSQEIEKLFAKSPWFDTPLCRVTGLDEMTLWDARKFVDFTRYDHLSFGQDNSAPTNS